MDKEKSRKTIRDIFGKAVMAVDPKEVIKRNVRLADSPSGVKLLIRDREYDLSEYRGIYVVGAGKAASSMAWAIEEVLGERIIRGIVNVKYGYREALDKITVNEAGHPLPDEAGVKGTRDILDLIATLSGHDLVICLISGGGSALMPLPCEGITLSEKQNTTKLLLECGATINEINAIRKHISRVKGGRFAKDVYPATLISLILSDVIGDRLDVIASGPTVPDKSTFADCLKIIEKYGITRKIPPVILTHLTDGSKGKREDTPKPGDVIFDKTQNVIIGNNLLAIDEARKHSEEMGYNPLILSSSIEGETKEVAKVHAAIAKEVLTSGNPVRRPACIISGGETTVTIHGSGLGGRNQEFVLAAAMEIDGVEEITVLSGGTDGTDGPTDAAGAIADGGTIERARKLKMDPYSYLKNNDSYHFFEKLDDLLITGPTNTNVMDLRLMIVD
ncbi:MAG: glycerate kinase [Pseudomonadota bacterium]